MLLGFLESLCNVVTSNMSAASHQKKNTKDPIGCLDLTRPIYTIDSIASGGERWWSTRVTQSVSCRGLLCTLMIYDANDNFTLYLPYRSISDVHLHRVREIFEDEHFSTAG